MCSNRPSGGTGRELEGTSTGGHWAQELAQRVIGQALERASAERHLSDRARDQAERSIERNAGKDREQELISRNIAHAEEQANLSNRPSPGRG